MQDRRPWILAGLAALGPFLWLLLHFEWTCDDAFISFRYAKHLARGDGLVFNPGESPPVEGFSNLLWVLWLTPWQAAGVSLPAVASWTSSLCGLGLVLLVTRLATLRLDLGAWGAVATALFLVTLPPFAIWATSGLETMPFALAVFGVYAALTFDPERPRPFVAATCAVLAALLRADGPLWCGFAFLSALLPGYWEGRGRLLKAVLVAGGILSVAVALQLLARQAYFGEWMPNTARIKAGFSSLRVERGWNYLVSSLLAVPSLGLVVLLASFGPLARHSRAALLPSALVFVVAAATYAVLVGGDFMAMGRFLVPALPFVALLFAVLCHALQRAWLVLPLAAAVVALGLLAAFDRLPIDDATRQRFHFRWNKPEARSEVEQWENMVMQATVWELDGRALALHTEPGESIVRGNVGAVGYFSELVIHDLNGLVSPEVADGSEPLERASPGHDRRVQPAFFYDRRPTYLSALLAFEGTPPAAGLTPEARRLMQRGELAQERYPLSEADGFPPNSELRLLRFLRD